MVTVQVNGDLIDESNETYFVNLSSPMNATISDGQGIGTIVDDDGLPSLSINDVTTGEGQSGTIPANFTVTLSSPSEQTVSVGFATADGSAHAPDDYAPPAATSSSTRADDEDRHGPGRGDLLDEIDESYFVNLSGRSTRRSTTGRAWARSRTTTRRPPCRSTMSPSPRATRAP